MSNLVHNERVKLGATLLNNLAVASFAGGVLLPFLSSTPRVIEYPHYTLVAFITLTSWAMAMAVGAQWLLGKLKG
jgi:hypothetical protein